MLTLVGYNSTHISTDQWYNIKNLINKFLDYAATHPDSKLTYQKSDMHIWFYTYVSYLTEPKSISLAGGYHYFSNKPKLPIQYDNPPTKHNHPVLVLSKVIDYVMSSTQ